jgi:hypothetical protein
MKKGETKVTFTVPAKMAESFRNQLDALSLKRDAFLAFMIERELPNLARELAGKKLSPIGRRHIAGSLKRMGTKRLGVVMSKPAAKTLRKCARDHGISRDAFVSRLVALLRSEKALLKALDLPEQVDQRRFRAVVEDMPTSPLKAMEAIRWDPLYYLRSAMEHHHGVGLYLARLPWDGLACYLADEDIPGTPEWRKREQELAEVLADDRKA